MYTSVCFLMEDSRVSLFSCIVVLKELTETMLLLDVHVISICAQRPCVSQDSFAFGGLRKEKKNKLLGVLPFSISSVDVFHPVFRFHCLLFKLF